MIKSLLGNFSQQALFVYSYMPNYVDFSTLSEGDIIKCRQSGMVYQVRKCGGRWIGVPCIVIGNERNTWELLVKADGQIPPREAMLAIIAENERLKASQPVMVPVPAYDPKKHGSCDE